MIASFLAALQAIMNFLETLWRFLTESLNATLILAIAACISAIVACYTAYLNYRSRPVLMRSIARHSNDLKRIALEWREQIPQAMRPDLARGGAPSAWRAPEKVHLPIEDEFLFGDMANHLPAEIPLLDTWTEY